jgi:glycosyltransferase involved in cell wall biosynthesis
MRVLLISDWGVPRGGAEVLTAALREELRGRGHDARVFASSVDGTAGFSDYTCRGFDPSSPLQTVTRAANPFAAARLRRVLREFAPDVVHVRMCLSQLSVLILPLLYAVPAVYHAVNYEAICPTMEKLLPDDSTCEVPAGLVCLRGGCISARAWPVLMAQQRLWRRWRGAFDVILANSSATRRQLLSDGIQPVEVVWNGVAAREPRPPLSDPPTVGFAGRLTWSKGADMLIRAFAEVAPDVPDGRLLISGDGPERVRLERLAVDLGLGRAVRMFGHITRDQVETELEAAWVHVVPSRNAEPFGLVAAEAMMRGTAVIASRAGGLSEIVEHDNTGLLVAPGDERALVGALKSLLRDRGLADRMGAAGRTRALRSFTLARFTDRMVEHYDRARALHAGETRGVAADLGRGSR